MFKRLSPLYQNMEMQGNPALSKTNMNLVWSPALRNSMNTQYSLLRWLCDTHISKDLSVVDSCRCEGVHVYM